MLSNHCLHYQDNHYHLQIDLVLQKIYFDSHGKGFVIQFQAIHTTKIIFKKITYTLYSKSLQRLPAGYALAKSFPFLSLCVC